MVAPRKPKTTGSGRVVELFASASCATAVLFGEMRTKLSRRSDSPSVVTETLAKLREYGMADDEKFSETFASSRLQNDGFGQARVLRDLRAKRVPSAVAEKAVQKTYEKTERKRTRPSISAA